MLLAHVCVLSTIGDVDFRFLMVGRNFSAAEKKFLQQANEEEVTEFVAKSIKNKFQTWGYTAKEAADMILDGVLAGPSCQLLACCACSDLNN